MNRHVSIWLRDRWEDLKVDPLRTAFWGAQILWVVPLLWMMWNIAPGAVAFGVAILLAVTGVPVEAYIRRRQDRVERLRRERVCLTCGYDCRATPNRCPECGRAPGDDPPDEA